MLPAAFAATGAEAWAPNLTGTANWHSNATYADRSADQLDSLQLNADILASKRFDFGHDDSMLLSAHFAGDWWPAYNALLAGAVGARGELQHQFGRDPLAPLIAVEGAVDIADSKEPGRNGYRTGVLARLQKRINALTRVTLWHQVAFYNADQGTYDYGASESALEVDRDITKVMRLTLSGRYRDGDIVTYASGSRPDLEERAPHRIVNDTFDRLMTAYRIDAQTWSGRISLARALDDASAILLAYEYRHSKQGPLKFTDNQLSVAMVHQF
jgi:hypothetical protein